MNHQTFVRRSRVVILATLAASSASIASAATLVGWTFEGAASNNLSAIVGGTAGITQNALPAVAPETNPLGLAASLTASHAAASKYYTGNGNGSATGFFSTAWAVDDYDQLAVNLAGYDHLVLSLDASGSNTGPKNFGAQYSLDGSTFVRFATYDVPAPNGTSLNFNASTYNGVFHFDLAVPDVIAGVQAFRLVDLTTTSVVSATVGASGTNRVDNLVISGTAVAASAPEPAALATLASGISLTTLRRRRSRR